jgi:Cof subfamily protein (haloacid dehalogenase superfamily)
MIKLVTIDLDGTLFDNEKKISKENKDAIKKAKENGCYIVIATGRPLNGVMPTLNELGLTSENDYVILYNGGKILNVGKNEIIYSSTIDGKYVKELFLKSKEENVFIHAFRENEDLITQEKNPYTLVEETINKINADVYDFNNIKDDELFIKAMLVASNDDITRITPIFKELYNGKYSVLRSSKIFLEFLNKSTNKGEALAFLANYLNIDMKDTMAIGDADNDIPMIVKANVGVAMKNAFPEVIDKANFITKSNLESGVAFAINKYINEI